MKILLSLALISFLLPVVVCGGDSTAQITFHIADDTGSVTGAPVSVSTFLRWIPGSEFGRDEYDHVQGVTDTNGMVTLKMPSKTGKVKYSVFAGGTYFDNTMKMMVAGVPYYRDMGGDMRFTNAVDDKWQPWNPSVEIQIKKVINPIPMYARFLRSENFPIPAYNTPLGYDLIKSDWLSPYGKGETADFIFKLDCKLGGQRSDGIQLFDAILTLSFSNEGDGIQEVNAPTMAGSVLRLPRYAPETGYTDSWVSKTYAHENGDTCEFKERQNFIFRVRTKKDDNGRIVSVLYGKISGPLFYEVRARGANMQMRYYMNPTANDRNLEFDPSKNLFKDLKDSERVSEP